MRFSIFLLFALGFTMATYSQDVVYLDTAWNKTTKEKAAYYRTVAKKNNRKIWYVTYFISGKKAKETIYNNGKLEGVFSEYYQTGELKITGKYVNGLKYDVWKTYYKNGMMKEKGSYIAGKKVGVWKTFY